MYRVVLISCASKKLKHRAKAREIYISTLFKFNLKYAEKLKVDAIYILSAKYGLITLDEEVNTYDLTLNTMSSSEIRLWAENVIEQIKAITPIDDTEFIFLAGNNYRKNLLPFIKYSKIPLKGLRIGEQLKKLKGLIG